MAASFFSLVSLFSLFLFSYIEAANNTDLIMSLIHIDLHRYQPIPQHRLQRRSAGLVHRFNLNPKTFSSPNTSVADILATSGGEYLMNMSIEMFDPTNSDSYCEVYSATAICSQKGGGEILKLSYKYRTHFFIGADEEFDVDNIFIQVSEDVYCFALAPVAIGDQ